MKLSDKQVKEFQDIYQKEFGELLDLQTAHDRGLYLVELIQLLFVPTL